MEIASRSGDFNLVDYTQDEYISIYDGLLNHCLDYTPDNEKSYNCETATNVYNQTYVNEYTVEGEELKHFYVIIQMRLSEIIPNLDPNGVYIFNIMLNKSEGRQITATMDTATAVVLSPSLGGDAPVYDVIMSSDKMITLTYTGAGLQASAINGKVKFEILAHENPLEENRSITISNIHIDQFKANMNIPIAMRVGAGYKYGFNGMERDDEVSGSGNSYDFGARIYDSRLGRWLATDALQAKYSYVSPYAFTLNNPIYYVDPDGNEVKVARQGDQSTVQAYLDEQAGSGIFKVKSNGYIKVKKSAYKAALKSSDVSDVRKEILKGVYEAVGHPKLAVVYTLKDKNDNAKPTLDNPDTKIGGKAGDQVELNSETLMGDNEGVTIDYDQKTFILIDMKSANEGTFVSDQSNGADDSEFIDNIEGANETMSAKTKPSASSVFIHELLDHFVAENIQGKSENRSEREKVKYQNKGLKNTGNAGNGRRSSHKEPK